jgi:Ca2+-binding EF-hand superfamily protein
MKDNFEKECDNYKLTRKELFEYFRCPENECNVLFAVFDPDNLGYVDAYEFLITMCLLSNGTL